MVFFDTDLASRASNFGTHTSWKEKNRGVREICAAHDLHRWHATELLSDGVGTAQAIVLQECIGKMTEITHEITVEIVRCNRNLCVQRCEVTQQVREQATKIQRKG